LLAAAGAGKILHILRETRFAMDEIEQYWQTYLGSLPPDAPRPAAYTAWSFGDRPTLADKLGALVLAGTKTATCSLLWEYGPDEVQPRPGEFSVILDGGGQPLCIIETLAVTVQPFNQVSAQHAYEEGEGDRSYAYWRAVHWEVFSQSCAALGLTPAETMPLVCERFRRVYPAEAQPQ
jgi:uncharacterized protein YhfF